MELVAWNHRTGPEAMWDRFQQSPGQEQSPVFSGSEGQRCCLQPVHFDQALLARPTGDSTSVFTLNKK